MNRSLRRLALLGLLTLGASGAGAQTFPTLFNITYTPSNLTLTITPTSNAASGNLPSGISSYSLGTGVRFTDLFISSASALVDPGTGMLAGTIPSGSGLKATVQRLGSAVGNDFTTVSNALLDHAYDQLDGNGRGLEILSMGQGHMYFDKSDNTTPAFNSSNTLTITFTSSTASQYLRASSIPGVAGYVNVGLGSGIDIGTYTYSVVPEPSTYAAIAGALGLGYAVYRRRRQAAAATAAA
jgi:hypothetical protein